MSTVADRIKFIRKHLHLNQMEFAKIIGISQTHISKIESGKDSASNKVFSTICSEFNISLDWLKTGSGAMESTDLPNFSKVITELKMYLMKCNKFESDMCSVLIFYILELLHCGDSRSPEFKQDILLQICDLLDNIVKLNKGLDLQTNSITENGKIPQNVDGAFWIKENYTEKIMKGTECLLNLYLGSGK